MTILKKNFFADFLKKRSTEFLVMYIIGKAGHSTFRICNQLNWLFSKMKIFFKPSVYNENVIKRVIKKIRHLRCRRLRCARVTLTILFYHLNHFQIFLFIKLLFFGSTKNTLSRQYDTVSNIKERLYLLMIYHSISHSIYYFIRYQFTSFLDPYRSSII